MAYWQAELRWRIAKDTGWPLDVIDGLSAQDVWEYLSLADGHAKADSHQATKRARTARSPRKRGRRR